MMKELINLDNNVYKDKSKARLILGESFGIKDFINIYHPKLVKYYDDLKSQDWKEDELSFTSDRLDLISAPQTVKDLFKFNVAYQIEIDSLLSETYATLLAPFITDSQYSDMLSLIQNNECLHYKSYMFIIRKVFSEPDEIFDLILKTKEVQKRSVNTFNTLAELKKAGAEYTLGLRENNQELFNLVFKGIFCFYILERMNFLSSFATTFIIPEAFNGLMMNSSKQIQKIAQDEIIHYKVGEYILKELINNDPRGKESFKQAEEELKTILEEAYQSELVWSDFILSEGREVVGLNSNLLKDYVTWNYKSVKATLGWIDQKEVGDIPLNYMKQWLNIDMVQHANQESSNNNYLLNTVINDIDDLDLSDF